MSREYAEKRIKEALRRCNGNAVKARQQVIAQAMDDPKLLQALTKAHLTGIVAYNIERILSGRGTAEEQRVPKAPQSVAKGQGGRKEENFGLELLKAVAGNGGAEFGLEGYSNGGQKRKKVSKSHIDAINALTKGRKFTE